LFSLSNNGTQTHNLWSVKIQAPVRFEWAVKLSVLLPVSNYSLLQPWIHLNLTTPCPDPGAGLPPPREIEAIKLLFRLGSHGVLCTGLSCFRPVPPTTSSSLSIPNFALSSARSLPGPAAPFPSHYSLSLSFHSQASRKACLHLLSSFLISNFLFNPLLPDLFCSVERL
uniref:Uncharacterized protein n=2 Tax=Canis lupus familiaris TaxID=9615 RepID=A0A8C0PRB4_CANLF